MVLSVYSTGFLVSMSYSKFRLITNYIEVILNIDHRNHNESQTCLYLYKLEKHESYSIHIVNVCSVKLLTYKWINLRTYLLSVTKFMFLNLKLRVIKILIEAL